MVEITDKSTAQAFLEGQTGATNAALAVRSALHALPSITAESKETFDEFLLPTMRAILIAAVNTRFESFRSNGLNKTASYAVDVLGLGLFEAAERAIRASSSVFGFSEIDRSRAATAAIEAAAYASSRDGRKNRDIETRTTFFEAISSDAEWMLDAADPADIYETSLWHRNEITPTLAGRLRNIQNFWGEDAQVWGFWHRWYDGFLNGTPIDWDVQLAVASIPDEEWATGSARISEIIKELELPTTGNQAIDRRQPEAEPMGITRLIKNPTTIKYQSELVSGQITANIEAFHRETGKNQLPDAFIALVPIAKSFQKVSTILKTETNQETEDALRQEIRRLKARIQELELALKDANQKSEPDFINAFKKKAGEGLGDWKMYAAIFASLWLISGDDTGPERRLEKLQTYRDSIPRN